jgi:hypothetical protein
MVNSQEIRELLQGFEQRKRESSKLRPLVDKPNWNLRFLRKALDGMVLPSDEPQMLVIITHFDIYYDSPGLTWEQLSVKHPGTWLKFDSADQAHMAVHADGTGQRLVMVGPQPEAPIVIPETRIAPPEPEERALWQAPNFYLPSPGQPLESIAQSLLGNSERWPEIWNLNQDTFPEQSSNLLTKGEALRMPDDALPVWLRLESLPPADAGSASNEPQPQVWLDLQVDDYLEALMIHDCEQLRAMTEHIPEEVVEDLPYIRCSEERELLIFQSYLARESENAPLSENATP